MNPGFKPANFATKVTLPFFFNKSTGNSAVAFASKATTFLESLELLLFYN
jgi:hypothetical protein